MAYSDAEQRGRLNSLTENLYGPLEEQILDQSTDHDSARSFGMSLHLKTTNDCDLCHKLQDDQRYLLVNLLNTQEVIKTSVKNIEKRVNRLDGYEGEEAEAETICCCIWPFESLIRWYQEI